MARIVIISAEKVPHSAMADEEEVKSKPTLGKRIVVP